MGNTANIVTPCVDDGDGNDTNQQKLRIQHQNNKNLQSQTSVTSSTAVNHPYDLTKEQKNMEFELLEHGKMLSAQRQNIHPYAYKILYFWYPSTFNECMELWFGKSTNIDATIKKEFGNILINALDYNKYDSWIYSSPLECLALIILLDQFPRNIYRNSPKMYSADLHCQAILSTAMWKCYHLELLPIHSVSFCLVLTHSESNVLQELCIRVWAQIRQYMPPNYASDLKLFDAIFQKHFDVIDKFGRFPHRNKILNRKSTNNEKIFLSNDEFRFDLPLKPTDDGFGFKPTQSYLDRFDNDNKDNNDNDQKDIDIPIEPDMIPLTVSRIQSIDQQRFDVYPKIMSPSSPLPALNEQ